jgi:cytochrome c oxidase subunit 2
VLRSRHTVPLALIALVVGGITIGQALIIDWLPGAATEQAERVNLFLWFIFLASAIFFTIVTTVLIYALWKFRAPPGDQSDGPPMHGNTRLEIVWTVVPGILLGIVAVFAIIVLNSNEQLESDRIEVDVVAQQFTWSFVYPDAGVQSGDLRIPVDRQVVLNMRAQDVIHSFYVPEFGQKKDVVPGIQTQLVLDPNETGTFDVICAELCGTGHALMRSRVIVTPQTEYDAWLTAATAKVRADRAQAQAPAAAPGAAEGSQEG